MNILCIDDDFLQIRATIEALSTLCHVRFAFDAKTATEQIIYQKPDLILLDIGMPKIDGLTYLKNLKNDPELKTVPVAIFSSYTDIRYKLEGLKSGAVDYFEKQLTKDELFYRIKGHLTNIQREQYFSALSLKDQLTGIGNRRCFDEGIGRTWLNRANDIKLCSLLLIDIDNFKEFNTCFGHPGGDKCLKQVASIIQNFAARVDDICARYGGEEFALMLPRCTLFGAQEIARGIIEDVKSAQIKHPGSPFGYITVSIGVATHNFDQDSSSLELLEAADKALYYAKKLGKNCFVLANSLED